jgi:hypothetical protein
VPHEPRGELHHERSPTLSIGSNFDRQQFLASLGIEHVTGERVTERPMVSHRVFWGTIRRLDAFSTGAHDATFISFARARNARPAFDAQYLQMRDPCEPVPKFAPLYLCLAASALLPCASNDRPTGQWVLDLWEIVGLTVISNDPNVATCGRCGRGRFSRP